MGDRSELVADESTVLLAPCHLFPQLTLQYLWDALNASRNQFSSLKQQGKKKQNLWLGRIGELNQFGEVVRVLQGVLRWRMGQSRGASPVRLQGKKLP